MFPSDTKKAKLARAIFKRYLYLERIKVGEQHLDVETIIKELKDLNALDELGIFYTKLFLQGTFLPDITSTPELVKENLDEMSLLMCSARFLENLCLKSINLYNKTVDPNMVIDAYKKTKECDEALGVFYHLIYMKKLKIDGQPVTTENIRILLKHYPKALSKFYSYLRRSDKSMEDMKEPESARNYPAITAENLMKEFLANTSSKLTEEQVLNNFPDTIKGNIGRAFF